MDTTSGLLVEVAKQVPALIVCAFIVVTFIRYLMKRDEVLQHLGDECHKAQRDANHAINENSKALGEISAVLRRLNGRAHIDTSFGRPVAPDRETHNG